MYSYLNRIAYHLSCIQLNRYWLLKSARFAIRRLQVLISAGDTSHQGLLSLPSLRGQ